MTRVLSINGLSRDGLLLAVAAVLLAVAGLTMLDGRGGPTGPVFLGTEYEAYESVADVARDADLVAEIVVTADLGSRVDNGGDRVDGGGIHMRLYEAELVASHGTTLRSDETNALLPHAEDAKGRIVISTIDPERYVDEEFTPFAVGDRLGVMLVHRRGPADAPGLLKDGENVYVPIAGDAGVSEIVDRRTWRSRSSVIAQVNRGDDHGKVAVDEGERVVFDPAELAS
jgi:hypothetical protein